MATNAKLLKGAAVSIISFLGAVAFADSPPAGFDHSSTVRFADLDLNRPHDVAKLYSRITLAADKLCGRRSLVESYSKRADYESCYQDTIAQAVARIHQPSLNAYFRLQGKAAVSRQIALAQP
jgi:UrcA family protein